MITSAISLCSTDQVHKRRRGDTIRASDFLRPSASLNSAPSASGTVPPPDSFVCAEPINTCSENVFLTNSPPQPAQPEPIEVLVTNARGVRKPLPRAKPRGHGTGRSRFGHARAQATIIMKIDDEPLPPQGSDEEDDELLLTGKKWEDPIEDA